LFLGGLTENEMYDSRQGLARLNTPLSQREQVERRRIQHELDRLLGSRSAGELELLQARQLMAVRNNAKFMAFSDAIADALDCGDVPDTSACWDRWNYLGEQIMLPVVQKFVASLRPASQKQRSIAAQHGITLPARCSSVEAGYLFRQALPAPRRQPQKG
jgi:hypothetical protein